MPAKCVWFLEINDPRTTFLNRIFLNFISAGSRKEDPEHKRKNEDGKHLANQGAVAADASVVSAAAASKAKVKELRGRGARGMVGERMMMVEQCGERC
jgi:hypothetical protein